VETYIVRIYRMSKGGAESVVGIVERPLRRGRKAFDTPGELWEILTGRRDGLKKGTARSTGGEAPAGRSRRARKAVTAPTKELT
jgi:hypothetical protein